MKRPTVLLYACGALLSIAASLILDVDPPRPQVRRIPAATAPEARSLARR